MRHSIFSLHKFQLLPYVCLLHFSILDLIFYFKIFLWIAHIYMERNVKLEESWLKLNLSTNFGGYTNHLYVFNEENIQVWTQKWWRILKNKRRWNYKEEISIKERLIITFLLKANILRWEKKADLFSWQTIANSTRVKNIKITEKIIQTSKHWNYFFLLLYAGKR